MSKEPGTPPTGESVSASIAPQSRPIEASELDDGWGDEPIEASLASVHSGAAREQQEGRTASPDLPAGSEVATGSSANLPATGEVTARSSANLPATGEVTARSSANLPATGEVAASQPTLAEAKRTSSILPQSLTPVVLSSSQGRDALTAEAIEPPATVKSTDVATKKASVEAKPANAKPAEAKQAETKPANAKPAEAKQAETKQAETKQAETKPANAKPAEAKVAAAKEEPKHATKSPRTGSRLGNKLSSGYVVFPIAVLAAGIALIVLRPKQPTVKPSPALAPAVAAQVPAEVVNLPAATTKQQVEQATASANAVPVDTAGVPPLAEAAASAGPLPSASAASEESFVDAFHKNAARSNAKWADVKTGASKPDNGKAGTVKPTAAKSASPGQADPLDVLKRLEEARKNKK